MQLNRLPTPNFDGKRIIWGLFALRTATYFVVVCDSALSLSVAMGAFWTGQQLSLYLHLLEAALCLGVIYAVLWLKPWWIIAYLFYSAVDIAFTALVFIPHLLVDQNHPIKGTDLRRTLTASLLVENFYVALALIGWVTILKAYMELAKDAMAVATTSSACTYMSATNNAFETGSTTNNITIPFHNNALAGSSEMVSTVSSSCSVSNERKASAPADQAK